MKLNKIIKKPVTECLIHSHEKHELDLPSIAKQIFAVIDYWWEQSSEKAIIKQIKKRERPTAPEQWFELKEILLGFLIPINKTLTNKAFPFTGIEYASEAICNAVFGALEERICQ